MTNGMYKINFLGDGRITLKDKIYVDENRPRVLDPLEHDKYKSHEAELKELRNSIQYYFHVLDEVRGEDWNKKPDHVLAKFFKAMGTDQLEYLNTIKSK